MDVENELRQAMAEHVSDVSASASLARDVRRGHRRTVRFRALGVAVAAAAVAFAAGMPAYQAFRPEPVGASGVAPGGGRPGGPALSARGPVWPTATPSANSLTQIAPRPSTVQTSPDRGSGGAGQVVRRLLTYLPAGLRQSGSCETARGGGRETTYCRWSGSSGLVELRLIRGSGFGSPSDLGFPPAVPVDVRVHGRPAIRGAGDAGSQVSWIERPGLGVWIGVSPALNDQLMRIAEGVRVPV